MASHRHSHIVARGSLKPWVKDGKVGVGWVGEPGPNLLPPAEIGVRSGFYRERGASGKASDWVDPAMGKVETKALPLLPIPAMAVREAPAAITSSGFMNTIELRLAVSPKLLLLMTWLDEYDHEPRTKPSFDQVQNHNSVVIAQAEHQWFHHPDYPPRV